MAATPTQTKRKTSSCLQSQAGSRTRAIIHSSPFTSPSSLLSSSHPCGDLQRGTGPGSIDLGGGATRGNDCTKDQDAIPQSKTQGDKTEPAADGADSEIVKGDNCGIAQPSDLEREKNTESSLGRTVRVLKRGNSDRDSDENDGPPPRRPRLSSPTERPGRLLACPFFKSNPKKYRNNRACSGPGWRAVHRIKEHIYRAHKMPDCCSRCNKTFGSESQLVEHIRASTPCEIQRGPPPDGANGEQLNRLKRRTKKKDMSEEQKWEEMYHILFPNVSPESIPSPYYEYPIPSSPVSIVPGSDLDRYEQFLRKELPSHVRGELEAQINAAFHPLEDKFREQMIEIFREAELHMLQVFRTSRLEQPELPAEVPATH